ncbi:MAG: hypothetical protein AAF709_23195 [Pseudomonadota bacterium]
MIYRSISSAFRYGIGTALASGLALAASAQAVPEVEGEPEFVPRIMLDAETVAIQDTCLTQMSGFPVDDPAGRYQFFVLTETVGQDVGMDTLDAMKHFGQPALPNDVAMVEVIEAIANPVMLQAQPSATVAQTVSLIEFSQNCAPYIRGQIDSLTVIEPSYSDPTFNMTIQEDALYLRQMAGEALARLDAHNDPVFGVSVSQYDVALLNMRNEIEFTAFESELDDLEGLYMADLDQKLALVNDQINEEMDREVLDSSIAISDDMSKASDEERKRRMLQTLFTILNRY